MEAFWLMKTRVVEVLPLVGPSASCVGPFGSVGTLLVWRPRSSRELVLVRVGPGDSIGGLGLDMTVKGVMPRCE